MKLNKQKVDAAIAAGKTHGVSVVKSVYYTVYYHYVSLHAIVDNDYNWIPAAHVQFANGAHGRAGVSVPPDDNDIPLRDLRGK